MRLAGQAVRAAMRSALAKRRGSACGELLTAPRPDAAAEEKSSARARAVWAVGRSYWGVPFSRIAGYPAMRGVPMPEATQGDPSERVGDCGDGVFAPLERVAAQGALLSQDDTPVRRLSCRDAHQQMQAPAAAMGFARARARTGRYPTALVRKGEERTLCLYASGRSHAGEPLPALVTQRQAGQAQPLVLSEALSSHAADEAALIRCPC
jgi:hypothetical protein